MSKKASTVPTFSLAASYRESADALIERSVVEKIVAGHRLFPAMFLYSHAVERFLKEYLRLKGYTEEKPFGHNLKRLWVAAKGQGLVLEEPYQASFENLIPLLESGHADDQFRYSKKSFNHSGPNWTRRDVGKLADAVAAEVEKQRAEADDASAKSGVATYPALQSLFVSIDLNESTEPRSRTEMNR